MNFTLLYVTMPELISRLKHHQNRYKKFFPSLFLILNRLLRLVLTMLIPSWDWSNFVCWWIMVKNWWIFTSQMISNQCSGRVWDIGFWGWWWNWGLGRVTILSWINLSRVTRKTRDKLHRYIFYYVVWSESSKIRRDKQSWWVHMLQNLHAEQL